MVKVSRELGQTMLTKKNMGNLRHSCLISDSHSPEGRVKSPETCSVDFFETPALALN